MIRSLFVLFFSSLILPGCAAVEPSPSGKIRIMTFNLEDVRTDDLLREDHPRLRAAARIIQRLRPDILLLNEIAYDQEGVPGFEHGMTPGGNGLRFAESFLAVSQGPDLDPLRYTAFMSPSNTGRASGYDLDHDGNAVTEYPEPPPAADDGAPARQTAEGRAYGNDSWGFGTFPGQYAMALLVLEGLDLLTDEVRTFRHFLWRDLPDGRRPTDPESGDFWYDDEVWDRFPLSSKSHWDVPVRLPGGAVIHVLASHPTPAAFDGPERRNKLRNRAEIKFWSDYISGAEFITDDRGMAGGLDAGASFVIMGDLNADPDEGSAVDDPIGTFLLSNEAVNSGFTPVADSAGLAAFPDLDPDDTAGWGMRVDYVLPSADIEILGGMIVRPIPDNPDRVSDHFPVYLDLRVGGS